MKSLFTLVACIAATCCIVSTAVAHDDEVVVFSQSIYLPDSGDHGAYSARLMSDPDDDESAIAFDNFSLPGTSTDSYEIAALCWDGIYSEAFPDARGETDFLVEIWAHDSSVPDLSGPLYAYTLSAGIAGVSDESVATTALGHTSPTTSTTPGGGPAYHYEADLPSVATLSGDTTYWLSIQALQTFPNAEPIFDPQWQWHLGGDDAGDGFFAQDSLLDPDGTPDYGILQFGKDLSFELKAVPEPSTNLMAFAAVCGLALIRRRR